MNSFKEANDYLESLQFFGIKLGLENIKTLLQRLNNPQNALPFIHLAGTNGKGSTGAMLQAMLVESGISVGFYSSPHLVTVRERFQIDGKPITEEQFIATMKRLRPHIETMRQAGHCPTYFEVTTALAIDYFATQQVDIVILETGMGGRFDATNCITPLCSVITTIALDHQEYLGDSIEKIAFEKAGIIKRDVPIFCGVLPEIARHCITKQAKDKHAPLFFIHPEEDCKNCRIDKTLFMQYFSWQNLDISLNMLGQAQQHNALLALTILKFLAENGFTIELENSVKALSRVKWAGRLQRFEPNILIDGAHNTAGAIALIDYLNNFHNDDTCCFIFGNFADKTTKEILEIFIQRADEFIFLPIKGTRPCCSPETLKQLTNELDATIPVTLANSVADALKLTANKKGLRVITGSLHLIGEAVEYLTK